MEAPEFEITVAGGLKWARVSVSGELDLATADQLREALDRELASGRSVLLDVGDVTFLDSTGLTVVLRATRAAQVNGWDFGVAAALSDAVARTARVAGVLPLLPLVEE